MATNDLSDQIRRDVEQGRPRDEIVASLLERGLSQVSAERFVDRALAAHAAGGPRPPTAPSAVAETKDEDRATFPWKGVLVAGVVVVGIAALIGYAKGRTASRRVQRAASAQGVELTREESAAVERVLAEAEAAKGSKEGQARQDPARVEQLLKRVRDPATSSMSVCTASLELGRMGASRAIPDLQARLADASSASIQNCAASALANLGEVAGPLAFFVAAIQAPTVEARRGGIMGLGELGPRGAAAALPYLAEALRSPDVMTRYVAVQSLGKLGPASAPLLRTALDDAEPMVKGEAKDALRAVSGR